MQESHTTIRVNLLLNQTNEKLVSFKDHPKKNKNPNSRNYFQQEKLKLSKLHIVKELQPRSKHVKQSQNKLPQWIYGKQKPLN